MTIKRIKSNGQNIEVKTKKIDYKLHNFLSFLDEDVLKIFIIKSEDKYAISFIDNLLSAANNLNNSSEQNKEIDAAKKILNNRKNQIIIKQIIE